MIVGDLNIDLSRNNAHSKRMKDIAHMYNLTFDTNHTRANYEFTYKNVGVGHCSSVDHFVEPNSLYDCIDIVECMDNRLNPSFHGALKLVLKVDIEKLQCSEKVYEKKSCACHRVKDPEKCFPKERKKESQIPYRNERVQQQKDSTLFWNGRWAQCGKPRHGAVFEIMKRTKHKYHYAIRNIKKRERELRISKMAEAMMENSDNRNFWYEHKKL